MNDTNETKRALFLTAINAGKPDEPSWMICDQYNRVLHEESGKWHTDHRMGSQYTNYAEIAWKIQEMLCDEYKYLPVQEFEVPINILIHSAMPLDKQEVAEWLHKACRFFLDSHGAGIGPLDGTFGTVVADWNKIKEV